MKKVLLELALLSVLLPLAFLFLQSFIPSLILSLEFHSFSFWELVQL